MMKLNREAVKKAKKESENSVSLEVARALGETIMGDARSRREADDRRATAFAQAAHTASALLVDSFASAESLVKIRRGLAQLVAFCTEWELEARPAIDSHGARVRRAAHLLEQQRGG